MSWTYDVGTDAGKVRLLLTDTRSDLPYFNDDEIQAFLDMEDSSIRRATALGLETIATNEALIQKVMKTLDVQTDGAKLADSLRERATGLREQENMDAGFAVAEQVQNDFQWRERIYKQYQRQSV